MGVRDGMQMVGHCHRANAIPLPFAVLKLRTMADRATLEGRSLRLHTGKRRHDTRERSAVPVAHVRVQQIGEAAPLHVCGPQIACFCSTYSSHYFGTGEQNKLLVQTLTQGGGARGGHLGRERAYSGGREAVIVLTLAQIWPRLQPVPAGREPEIILVVDAEGQVWASSTA
jgi:hypothetical protein